MSSKWVDANGNQWRFSAATNTWQALVNGRWVARPLPAGGLKRGDLDRYKPGTAIVETMGPPGASGAPGPMMSVQPLNTKSTPDDDDQFILADSDDFWNLRKISSTDLKSAMLNHVYTTEVSLSNKTLINPRVSDTIRDGAGGSVLKIEGASGSVNHLAVRSSATGNAVGLAATGSDAAINIAIDPKGAGQVLLGGVPAVTTTGTQTLTNKTISLTNNTLVGTIGQFNTALTGADFATIAGTETLTGKTLTSPTITGASITGSSVTGASALSMGNTTLTGTTTPLFLSLGGTYGTSTAGSAANLKLKVHEDTSAAFGLGISTSNLEYQVPLSNYAHRFYAGGTEVAAITSTGITASGVAVPTVSSTSTLTNKTLSGANNTFSAVPQSAVTNLTSDLAARELAANKGQPSGYASLDSGGKVPVTQLPHSIMQYQGTWNVSTNTPALADGSGDTGDVYRVTVGGSRNLGSGSITFDVGDYAIYNGTVWEKSDTTDAVASVNGYTGNVSLNKSDVGLGNVDNTSDATRNAASATLTNKTISLGSNTVTGTVAQFNTALSDGDFATLAGTETLTNKTITEPKISTVRHPTDNQAWLSSVSGSLVYISPNGNSALQVGSVASAVNYVRITGAATGVNPAVTSSGTDTNVSLELNTRGSGTVKANGVDVATISGAQTLTNKTISGASNTITNLPASATPDAARLVCKTATGGSGVENGANTWAKLVTLTPAVNGSCALLLGITTGTSFQPQTAILQVWAYATQPSPALPLVAVQLIGMPNSGYAFYADGFKLVNNGYGQPVELWIKKSDQYTDFSVTEISRSVSGTVTYNNNAAWQSAEPTGSAINTRSTGVTISGVPVVTTTATQTLTNKTLTSPTVNNIFNNSVRAINFSSAAGAVDYFDVNNATGTVGLRALGTSTNIGITLEPKGNGKTSIYAATGQTPAIAATGADANHSLNLVPKGSGTVQANGVPVVTTTGAQDLTNKTLTSPTITSPTGNIVTSIDGASGAITGVARRVATTSYTGAVTNQWAKVLTWTASTAYYSQSILMGFVATPGVALTATVLVQFTNNAAGVNPTGNVYMTSLGSDPGRIDANAFKLVGGAYGEPIELWVKQKSYTALVVFEIARYNNGGTLTYLTNDPLQGTEPVGSVINVSTNGVVAGDVPVVTTTGTQTLTNKTLTSPRVNQILDTNGAIALDFSGTPSAANYLWAANAVAADFPKLRALGSATDVSLGFRPKGAGTFRFQAPAGEEALQIVPIASAVNYFRFDSSATGSPLPIWAGGTDTNIGINLRPKGSGTVQQNGVPVVTTTGAQAVQNKTLDSTNTSTKFISRSVATVTAPTALGSTAATDYVTFADMRRTVALLHCEGSDGSTTVVDSSNLGAGWTCAGNAQLDTAQYKFGSSSLLFDGTGDYITPTAAAENFAFAGDFTVEMWIRPTTSFGTSRIVYDNRPPGASGAYTTIYILPTGVINYYTNGVNRITGPTLSLDTWYHVAVSRASGTTRMFIDGTQTGSSYTDANSYLARLPKIGSQDYAPGADFLGHMDEISIVNGLARYTSNFTPPTAPLNNVTEDVSTAAGTVALLHCDGANASTTVTDSGVLLSNWTAAGNAQISTAQSKFGGSSLVFDGTGDYITPTADSSNFAFGTGDFTIEMFVRPNDVTNPRYIFDGRPSGGNGAYPAIYVNAGNLYFYVQSANRITATAPPINTWSHIAVCRASGTTRMFVGGVEVGSSYSDANSYLPSTGRPFVGANRDAGSAYDGYMDEIRISRVARYVSNFTPPTVPHPDPPAIKIPTAVANTNRYTVKCTGPQPVLLSNGQGQTINGGGTVVIEQDESLDSVSTGAVWRLV